MADLNSFRLGAALAPRTPRVALAALLLAAALLGGARAAAADAPRTTSVPAIRIASPRDSARTLRTAARRSAPATRPSARLPRPGEHVEVDELPAAIHKVPAIYPNAAREAGLHGLVWVRALVGADGRVKDARVVRPVSPLLDGAAVAAVRQWVFTPARTNQRAVAYWVKVPVNFTLEE